MSNKRFFTLMTIGTILLLLILVPQERFVDAGLSQSTSSPEDVTDRIISELKSSFAEAKSPEVQENLQNKIQALEYKQQVQAEAMVQPQKSLEDICKSIAVQNLNTVKQMDNSQPLGILDLEEDFLGDRGYLTNNMWRGEFSGYETELYAGHLLTDPQQGMVLLHIPILNFLRVIMDPTADGSLTITNVEGYQVQLSTVNDNLVNFDIPSQQFINELTKSMSVFELPPMPTPVPDPCEPFYGP